MPENWWITVNDASLAQGDLLPDCLLPVFVEPEQEGQTVEQDVVEARLIVVTQSCDLENEKVEFVALCPIHTLTEFEARNPKYKGKEWDKVRTGKVAGLHLLVSPENPADNLSCYVVDFGHIVSLPLGYLKQHAMKIGNRSRLVSPYLEHFSQALARFFMRVGLPSSIPAFR